MLKGFTLPTIVGRRNKKRGLYCAFAFAITCICASSHAQTWKAGPPNPVPVGTLSSLETFQHAPGAPDEVAAIADGHLAIYALTSTGQFQRVPDSPSPDADQVAKVSWSGTGTNESLLILGDAETPGLYLLENDAQGELSSPQQIPLPSGIVADSSCRLVTQRNLVALTCGAVINFFALEHDKHLSLIQQLPIPSKSETALFPDPADGGFLARASSASDPGSSALSSHLVQKTDTGQFSSVSVEGFQGHPEDADGDLTTDYLEAAGSTLYFYRPNISPLKKAVYTSPEGCKIAHFATGVMNPVPYSRGLDIVVEEDCNGQPELRSLISQAQLQFVPTIERSRDGETVTLSAFGLNKQSAATGDLLIFSGQQRIATSRLDVNGVVKFRLSRKHPLTYLSIAYAGDDNYAAVAYRFGVSRSMPIGLRLKQQAHASALPAVLYQSAVQPQLLLAQDQQSGLPYLATAPASGATSHPLNGSPVTGTQYYLEFQYQPTGSSDIVHGACDNQSDCYDFPTYQSNAPPGTTSVTSNSTVLSTNPTWNETSSSQQSYYDYSCNCSVYYTLTTYIADVPVTFSSAGNYTLSYTIGNNGDGDSGGVYSSSATIASSMTTPPISVSCSPNQITYASQNTTVCTASVGGGATGTVNFSDNGNEFNSLQLQNGSASAAGFANYAAGTYNITAYYLGDSTHNSTSATTTLTINRATPAVSVSCSPNPKVYGSSVSTCVASVSGGATGTVQFAANGAAWTSPTLSNGSASTQWFYYSPVGTVSVTANYLGDGNHNPTTSPAITYVITPMPVNAAVTSSSSTAEPGQPVTFTCSATGAEDNQPVPGTVQFSLDGQPVAEPALTNGSATWSTALTAGSHQIACSGPNNGNYQPFNASTTEDVQYGPTVSSLATSTTVSQYGQPITLSGLVSTGGIQPTGGMSFSANGTQFASTGVQPVQVTNQRPYSIDFAAWLSGGATVASSAVPAPDSSSTAEAITATSTGYYIDETIPCSENTQVTDSAWFSLPDANQGIYAILMWAKYLNANGNLVGQAQAIAQPQPGSWTRYSATGTTPAGTTQCWLSFEVLSAPATGASSGTYLLWGAQTEFGASSPGPYVATASAAVTGYGASYSLATTTLPVGTDAVIAQYAGDSNTAPSTSAPVTVIVSKASPAMMLTASPAASTVGAPVTFTAVLTPATASGTVAFTEGGTVLGTATVSSGSATLTTSALPIGTDVITAQYGGDGNDDPASAVTTVIVSKATPIVTVSPTPNPATYGQAVTVAISLSNTSATGTAQVMVDGTLATTATIVGGKATVKLTAPVGAVTITVNYAGDSDDNPAAGVTELTVNKAPVTLTAASNLNPSTFKQEVTLSVTAIGVSGQATPTGTVAVTDGAMPIGIITLVNGAGSLQTSTLHAGSHTLEFLYSGDNNYR